MDVSFPAIMVSTLLCFIFSGLWYGPIMGKTWASLMFTKEYKPSDSVFKKALALQAVGTFLKVWVLAYTQLIWRPSTWGIVGQDGPDMGYGFRAAFFPWLGFFMPQQLSKVLWEGRPWKVFYINIAHDFINLFIASSVLACSCWKH